MFRLFAVFFLIFAVSGCSTTKEPFVYEEVSTASDGAEDGADSSRPIVKKKGKIDYSKPATFDEYRQWREANDPSGQTYAEYKEWEAAYKQWIKNQRQAIQ